MIKAVPDTNIYVSSIFWEMGNPHKIIELAISKKIEIFTTLEILKELEKVLIRDFETPEDMAIRQINLVLAYSTLISTEEKINAVKDDPDDNKIVECAVAANAEYIISGDKHLLRLRAYKQIKIVTAKEFCELLSKQSS